MSKSQIESLLRDTTVQLKALEKSEERFAQELAPNFRLFELFRVDEMTVSRCLACLLDPKGKHGQGPLFLESFLEYSGLKKWVGLNRNADVKTEVHVRGVGRIDILLKLGGAVIAIENKPWAVYGDNQLGKYADWLKSGGDAVHWALICLANEDPPGTALDPGDRAKLEGAGKYTRMDFEQIEDWLAEAAFQSRALPVRIFVEEFSKYIRYHINGALEMAEVMEIASLVDDTENLKSAIAIANAWPEIRTLKLGQLKEQLKEKWESGGGNYPEAKVHWHKIEAERSGCWFGFTLRKNQVFLPCFEFDGTGLNNFCWGVSTLQGEIPDEHKAAADRIRHRLSEEFNIKGEENAWWPWYTYADQEPFEVGFRNWQTSAQPWSELQNNKLAERFVKLTQRIYATLDAEPGLLTR